MIQYVLYVISERSLQYERANFDVAAVVTVTLDFGFIVCHDHVIRIDGAKFYFVFKECNFTYGVFVIVL